MRHTVSLDLSDLYWRVIEYLLRSTWVPIIVRPQMIWAIPRPMKEYLAIFISYSNTILMFYWDQNSLQILGFPLSAHNNLAHNQVTSLCYKDVSALRCNWVKPFWSSILISKHLCFYETFMTELTSSKRTKVHKNTNQCQFINHFTLLLFVWENM